jgi:magnesium-transporting ATPase (P-type)
MSVLLRTPENKLIIFCKGADDVLKNRLIDNDTIKGNLLKVLNDFANEGLRTLVVAEK